MALTRNIRPGFVAEAALTPSARPYRTVAGTYAAAADGSVVAQLSTGGDVLGDIIDIFSNFGCYLNYSICLLGCVWEWGKWQGIDATIATTLGQKCALDCEVELLRCKGGLPPGGGIPLV
jgi:hypothetical protein